MPEDTEHIRKSSKKSHNEKEGHHQSLFDNAFFGIFHSTTEGRWIRVNPALSKMLKFDFPQEMIDTINDVRNQYYVKPEKYAEIIKEAILRDDWVKSEIQYYCQDESVITTDLSIRKVLDSDGSIDYLEGVVQDISERKKIEKALQESENKYRSLFENSADGMLVLDENSHILELNERFCQMLGYDIQEMKGINPMTVIHPDDTKDIQYNEALEKILKGETILSQYRLRKKDNSYLPVELSTKMLEPGRFLNVVRDVSLRTQSDMKIRTQYLILKGINESFKSPLFSVNTDYEYTSFNVAHALTMKSLYGTEVDLGKSMIKCITIKEDREKAKQSLDKALQGNSFIKTAYSGEDSSTRRYFEVSYNAINNNDRKTVGVAVLARDLTDSKKMELDAQNAQKETFRLLKSEEKSGRVLLSVLEDEKRAREEIKKLNEVLEQRVIVRTAELEAVNKELETFTYSVSHDLKAPLRGIDGYSKLLFDSYKNQLDEEANIFIDNIRDSTLKMNQLIDDLLEYSRLERSHMMIEKIKVKDLISSIVSNYKEELKTGSFKMNIGVEDVEILADSKGLTIALRNLIENAIKFTKERKNPTIDINVEETPSFWILIVKDNGIGFEKKYNKKIFEIFQRLHRAEDFPGTGIGLAMVHKAMQRMCGKVRVESSPNKGSTFYLEIPKPS